MKQEYYRLSFALLFLFFVVILGVLLRVYEVPMLGFPSLFRF
jgi:hypothetical protein